MTQNSQKPNFSIVSGPSREELFDGLRLAHEGRQIPLTIVLVEELGRTTFHATIQALEREDGSGDKWLLKLYARCTAAFEKKNLEAYYDTTRRTGWVRQAK